MICMKTIYDVRQLLKRFGTVIYVGDRLADLELMEDEIREMYQAKFIDTKHTKWHCFFCGKRHHVSAMKKGRTIMDKLMIGADIGGTSIKLGIIDQTGAIWNKWSIDTNADSSEIIPDLWNSIQGKWIQ